MEIVFVYTMEYKILLESSLSVLLLIKSKIKQSIHLCLNPQMDEWTNGADGRLTLQRKNIPVIGLLKNFINHGR